MTLTPPEHEHSAAIDVAAEWLSQHPRDRIGRPIIPALRERFGVTIAEACEICREANLRRQRAA
ncbi:MAG: hypothetical protein EOS25_05050 [Mesorhizobium sp.]|nr:MAG: hypothetical protein EOS59_07740 [Mesorhizobium sp.]RWE58565.1 MAG: hypothetical protein EOS24_17540 [Mesorhizobium sp.]RWF09185.1 MAG: hypothetical protein EOS69_20345 [Mesorhizobium sp.]RWF21400.1 MAG: hypothetical protein EOS25_05050 [Mesorhizobium sp.]TIW47960.1 MAG: hypothetical protein E5V71_02910 [Mesorhizobium sp.]